MRNFAPALVIHVSTGKLKYSSGITVGIESNVVGRLEGQGHEQQLPDKTTHALV
jgi:hypothetical protein